MMLSNPGEINLNFYIPTARGFFQQETCIGGKMEDEDLWRLLELCKNLHEGEMTTKSPECFSSMD